MESPSGAAGYEIVVGLEIHAELTTASKMFCGCANDPFDDRPNVHVCPVCMGHPGTLPVPNKEAIRAVRRVGLAIGGTLADRTEFDRKNYFYPDIPKGYQITQYLHPLVTGGEVAGVAITRIHLEEDTAASTHDQGDYSLVNYNRAGVPLMELVTEPVIRSAEQAGAFGRELQLLLRFLGVSEANMEKGEMRVEVNVSVRKKGSEALGTKVEVKNIASFRAVERSIAYEFERQVALIEKGGEVVQETRGFDDNTGKTTSQRKKESSHDYRYFPEPDIPKLDCSRIPGLSIEELRESLPELPWQARTRLIEVGAKAEQAETMLYDARLRALFDGAAMPTGKADPELCANYITSDLVSLLKQEGTTVPSVDSFAELMNMVATGDVSSRGAKDTLAILVREPQTSARAVAEREGWIVRRDPAALAALVEALLAENPQAVAEFKAGKVAAAQFLVGQGMKRSKGSVDPASLRTAIDEALANASAA